MVAVTSSKTHRPGGVWFFTIIHTLLSIAGMWSWGSLVLDGIPDAMSSAMQVLAPWLVFLCATMLVCSWGAWAGSRAARNWMLVVLALIVVTLLEGLPGELLSIVTREIGFSALPFILIHAGVLIGWAGLAFWYFLASGAKLYYWTKRG